MVFLPLMVIGRLTYFLMVPVLFKVLSTLYTTKGFSRSFVSNFSSLAKFWSMNLPPAPLSISPRVLTFFSFLSSNIRINNEFLFRIVAACTEYIERDGDTGVDPDLLKQNPLRTSFSHHPPSCQRVLVCAFATLWTLTPFSASPVTILTSQKRALLSKLTKSHISKMNCFIN